jgi:hypothetical protein
VVRSQGESTTVSVLNEAGAPESSANAERIVRVAPCPLLLVRSERDSAS